MPVCGFIFALSFDGYKPLSDKAPVSKPLVAQLAYSILVLDTIVIQS
jgi:hypothetical protein